jgi:hypothetical protein
VAEWNVGPDELNLGIGSDNRADFVPRCGTLAGFSVEAGGDEGIAIQLLEPGTTLIVQTRNSEYRVVVLDGTDREVIVTGGQLFQDATRVRLDGATAGGSLLKIGWIGVGLRVEMSLAGRRIVTSPVRSITIEGV